MLVVTKILGLLTPSELKRLWLLIAMMIVMAILDMTGMASIVPLMGVLADPKFIENNIILKSTYNILGFTDYRQFIPLLCGLVLFLLVITTIFKALTIYMQVKFAMMREYSFSKRLVEGYLHQPYIWFIDHHSAELGKTILSEVTGVIGNALNPLLSLISQSAVAIAILTLLLLVDLKLALTIGVVIAIAYGLIMKLTGGYIRRIGKERLKANEERFTSIFEAFGAAKEVKIGGLEQAYIRRFSKPAYLYAKHATTAAITQSLPRLLLELIAFGGILLIILLNSDDKSMSSILPIISLYAVAAYRLMPAMQQIYSSITKLRFSEACVDTLYRDLVKLKYNISPNTEKKVMVLKKFIELEGLNFSYPNVDEPALKNLNLKIPAYSRVAFVGATGSGKTTIVDLILGLLTPEAGTVSVDGQVIDGSNSRAWQNAIGYVPQHIYLSDESIKSNIAFGINPEQIDMQAVEQATKIAGLHKFVKKETPKGYDTVVGERGVRLSGGQRQRIGIARALYHQPKVLILDEATSALDNLTEEAVMQAMNNLKQNVTLILIAHRLTTVQKCDLIFLLEKGQVRAKGTYEELQRSSKTFQKMTQPM